MTSLRAALDDYLRIRRRLGFAMPQDGRLLEGFVEFLQRAGAERITAELALEWARMPVAADPSRWGQRLGVARGFARHLATIDPTSEVPSKDLLPGRRSRIAPYIYSEAEIAALMAAARALRPRLRAARHETLIGLLAVTGMRPGEALGLDRQDVDLGHGAVHIRAGKQKKQREVPLHESTISALGRYARQRDAGFPTPSTPAFFISARGRRMGRGELNQTFTKLIGQVGLEGRGARARPRPHDLRHTLAVRTLIEWYRPVAVGGVAVGGAFDVVVAHLAADDAGVGAQPALGEQGVQDLGDGAAQRRSKGDGAGQAGPDAAPGGVQLW